MAMIYLCTTAGSTAFQTVARALCRRADSLGWSNTSTQSSSEGRHQKGNCSRRRSLSPGAGSSVASTPDGFVRLWGGLPQARRTERRPPTKALSLLYLLVVELQSRVCRGARPANFTFPRSTAVRGERPGHLKLAGCRGIGSHERGVPSGSQRRRQCTPEAPWKLSLKREAVAFRLPFRTSGDRFTSPILLHARR